MGNYTASLSIANSGAAGKPKSLPAYLGTQMTIGSATSPQYGICTPAISGASFSYWTIAEFTIPGGNQAMRLVEAPYWRIVGNDFSCPNNGGASTCVEIWIAVTTHSYMEIQFVIVEYEVRSYITRSTIPATRTISTSVGTRSRIIEPVAASSSILRLLAVVPDSICTISQCRTMWCMERYAMVSTCNDCSVQRPGDCVQQCRCIRPGLDQTHRTAVPAMLASHHLELQITECQVAARHRYTTTHFMIAVLVVEVMLALSLRILVRQHSILEVI